MRHPSARGGGRFILTLILRCKQLFGTSAGSSCFFRDAHVFSSLPQAGLSDVTACCLYINGRVGAFLTQHHRCINNEVMCGNYGEEK